LKPSCFIYKGNQELQRIRTVPRFPPQSRRGGAGTQRWVVVGRRGMVRPSEQRIRPLRPHPDTSRDRKGAVPPIQLNVQAPRLYILEHLRRQGRRTFSRG